MALVSNGAVRMKITSSTSMTSTKGVTLMSLKGLACEVLGKRPNAMMDDAIYRLNGPVDLTLLIREQMQQVLRKTFQHDFNLRHHAAKDVVGQHGRYGHSQSSGRHHQSLADWARHPV